MKRFLLILTLVLTLVSCGETPTKESENNVVDVNADPIVHSNQGIWTLAAAVSQDSTRSEVKGTIEWKTDGKVTLHFVDKVRGETYYDGEADNKTLVAIDEKQLRKIECTLTAIDNNTITLDIYLSKIGGTGNTLCIGKYYYAKDISKFKMPEISDGLTAEEREGILSDLAPKGLYTEKEFEMFVINEWHSLYWSEQENGVAQPLTGITLCILAAGNFTITDVDGKEYKGSFENTNVHGTQVVRFKFEGDHGPFENLEARLTQPEVMLVYHKDKTRQEAGAVRYILMSTKPETFKELSDLEE